MKKILYIIALTCSIGFMSSCADLDFKEPGKLTDPWNTAQSGNLYLNSLYNASLPTVAFGRNANLTEEGDATNSTLQGSLDHGEVGNFGIDAYRRIRFINIGIKGCEQSSLSSEDKEMLLAQMYFLRAYEYFELTKLYGGVPIILDAQQPTGNVKDLNVARSTAKKCFERILQDLDYAVKYCPISVNDDERGRVTRMAAAAFRSRVYLTYASPLFNPQNDQQRWKDAYQASLDAKNLCLAGKRDLNPVFNSIFLEEGFSNPEVVWVVPYDFTVGKTHGWENSFRPESQSYVRGTRPGVVPTKDLTDAFPMKDGKKISESSVYPYNMQTYWLNRDDRFKSTIAYNGAEWGLNNVSGRKQWTYQGMSGENRLYMLNLGAYCRKASNVKITNNANAGEYTAATGVDWIEIRYAEVLLNLAESANEAGYSSDAYNELYSIRKRAGIEIGDGSYGLTQGLSKENLREVILNERLVEFAYEDKRYWDMRRRLMYTEALGTNTPSFNSKLNRYTYVVRPQSPYTAAQIDAIRETINIDTDSPIYFNVVETKRDVQYPLKYQKKYYFFDVPEGVLKRCIDVEQTIGWSDSRGNGGSGKPGTFDPLSDQGGTPWKDEL